MTPEKVAAALESRGWKRYPDSLHPEALCLQGPRLSGPACECNDRPPSAFVRLYPRRAYHDVDVRDSAEVWVAGERDDAWVEARIYSMRPEDVLAREADLVAACGRIWRAFCEVTP